jgi:hypothetical protein
MRDLMIILLHIFVTVVRIARPGGVRSVIAESVLLKHQLLILNRSRHRAPSLRIWDRLMAGFCAPVRKASASGSSRHCAQAFNVIELSSGTGAAKVSFVVFPKAEDQAGTKGTRCRHHSRRDRDETTESDLGLPAYCRADQSGIRHLYK